MAWVQSNIAATLLSSDRAEKEREAVSWTKLPTSQLDPMLASYLEGGASAE
jgi:hypothetical protein